MSLQMVLAVAYQALRGHLYHALGLLLATSMAGMAIGAQVATRVGAQGKLGRALAWAAGTTVATAAVLSLAPMAPGLVSAAVVPLLLLVGAATGAIYPLALQVSTHKSGARIYAWDLVGAAGAAFLTSVVAIPLLGLVAVTLICGVLVAIAAAANLSKT
jgi:hypothetical protein